MGYGTYDTQRGLAGYNVEDTCHEDGCDEQIDRGLSFLCGDQPGYDGEFGCGWWFCGKHLFGTYDEPGLESTSGQCKACLEAYEEENPEAVTRAQERLDRLVADLRAHHPAVKVVGGPNA